MAVIAERGRAGAAQGPDIGQRALLADPGLVLEPDLDGLVGGLGRQGFGYARGEVFLKAVCASISFLGL